MWVILALVAAGGSGRTPWNLFLCLLDILHHIMTSPSVEIHLIHVMCLGFSSASLWAYWSLPAATLSLSRCFARKSTSLWVAAAQIHMWSMRESNAQLANRQTDLWEPCVSLSAFPGARSVCAGSEEAEALIKEQAWYRDASLIAWGYAAWWAPDDSHQTGLRPPSWQPAGARITFSCFLSLGLLWDWRGKPQIKGTFSFNGTLKLSIDHRKVCYLMCRGCTHALSSHLEPLSVSHQM